jgi:hypothetical protein
LKITHPFQLFSQSAVQAVAGLNDETMVKFGRSSFLSASPRWLVIEAGRRWSSASVQWGVAGALLVAMVLGLAGVGHGMHTGWQERSVAEQAWSSFQAMAEGDDASASIHGSGGASLPAADTDFTARLPLDASLPDLVQMVQREASPLNVQLQGLQAKAGQAPGPTRLGRSELVLNLRGNYPAVRQVLASTLARYPHVTLPTLRLRRAEGSTEVEATATLSVWTRPLGASPSEASLLPSVSGAR